MQLQFESSYLSITDFPKIELPKFAVVTGINGVGKTHLLGAIVMGKIKNDITPNQADIRLFNWHNLSPNDAGFFDGHNLLQYRTSIYSAFEKELPQHVDKILNTARSNGIAEKYLAARNLAIFSYQNLIDILGNPEQAYQAHQSIQDAISSASTSIYFSLSTGIDRNSYWHTDQVLDQLTLQTGRPLIMLERNDFFEYIPAVWGQTDLFQHSFAPLFVAYRDLKIENDLKRLRRSDGDLTAIPLSSDEFTKKYNIPPWDFVNNTFRKTGLDFKIDHPDLRNHSPYQPRLTKLSTGTEVRFTELSSGEKILMSFAFCVYYGQDNRQIANFPKVLLLDEVDAPLHPSMSRMLMRTITEVLVKEHGINVIFTTHSPSTVAVAPDESIYVMKPNLPGLHKVSKGEALNVLTFEVPTLAISFDGRRQVFVENVIDSEIYERLYQVLKRKIQSERSLNFIAVGRRKDSGPDENTGCDQVKQIVANLTEAGNISVLGLIDWDTSNTSLGRVFVLAEGRRYAIENCIYDPILLAALVVREIPGRSHKLLGLTDQETYISFKNFPTERLQVIAEEIEKLILGIDGISTEDKFMQVGYCNGSQIRLRKAYLKMMGHNLEERVLQVFPEFNKINRHTGDLLKWMVNTVISDMPELVPDELSDIFTSLLTVEIYS